MVRQVISEEGVQQCLTDECFLNVSCAHQKKCVSALGKDLEGILGGVNLERPHCRVRRGAEVRFVMELQRLHEGLGLGVQDQVIPGKKNTHKCVCFLKRQLLF